MFKANKFNIIEMPMPTSGMNQEMAPEVESFNYAYLLENIIPEPLGEGRVRYGLERITNTSLPTDSTIIKIFNFENSAFEKQFLLYVVVYKQDTTATSISVNSDNQLSFTTDNASKFIKNTNVKIQYTKNGVHTLTGEITKVEVNGKQVTLTFVNNFFPVFTDTVSIVINQIQYESGSIYKYENTLTLLKSDLATATVPRSVFFKNNLILCNGVDKIMSWDGTNLNEIYDFVQEKYAYGFVRKSDTELEFRVQGIFDKNKYTDNNVQLRINGGEFITLSVASISVTDKTTTSDAIATITTSSAMPSFQNTDAIELFYKDYPPRFSFIGVAHGRLWALGEGAVTRSYRKSPMYVYYAYRPDSITAWFDEATKTIRYINLGNRHGASDSLEYIGVLHDKLIFMGRKQTQVWRGTDPTDENSFTWESTLEGGCLHGNLCLGIFNHLWLITPHGIMTLSALNVARQLAFTSVSAIDSLVRKYIAKVLNNEKDYRVCDSFVYQDGGFLGFKVGNSKTIIGFNDTQSVKWSLYSGYFEKATSFNVNADYLYVGVNSYLHKYGDKDVPVYKDHTSPISFKWILPKVSMKGKRFACKRFSIDMEYPSSFVLNDLNHFNLHVFGDLRETFDLITKGSFFFKGDLLETIPLAEKSKENVIGTRLDLPYKPFMLRTKFVSSSFWVSLEGQTDSGAVIFKNLKFYGKMER